MSDDPIALALRRRREGQVGTDAARVHQCDVSVTAVRVVGVRQLRVGDQVAERVLTRWGRRPGYVGRDLADGLVCDRVRQRFEPVDQRLDVLSRGESAPDDRSPLRFIGEPG